MHMYTCMFRYEFGYKMTLDIYVKQKTYQLKKVVEKRKKTQNKMSLIDTEYTNSMISMFWELRQSSPGLDIT